MYENMSVAEIQEASAKVRFLAMQIVLGKLTLETVKERLPQYYDAVVEELKKYQ